jgi:hypothetical protein
MTTRRVPDEDVTPELQALWSLANDLRIANAEAGRADTVTRCRFEQARASALEVAVAFATEAARLAGVDARARDAAVALRTRDIKANQAVHATGAPAPASTGAATAQGLASHTP